MSTVVQASSKNRVESLVSNGILDSIEFIDFNVGVE